ncbi:MAG: undecaprenyl-diphosphatase UppP [Candidatus Kapaibacterium sp.]
MQGLTEFLPISSTAHLTLAGHAFGLIDPNSSEGWTAFIAVIQLGTLAAVLLYFRRDIVAIVREFIRDNMARVPFKDQSTSARLGRFIILGTIPIVVLGLALKPVIEGHLTKDLRVIGISLIGLALILWIAERVGKFKRPIETLTTTDAVAIGLAQTIALIPGASRSGTTMTAAFFRGLTREAAARFSFLLSIPAVGASGLLEFYKSLHHIDSANMLNMGIAAVVAGISGYWSIAFLLRYLRTRSTLIFIVYRILLGGAILAALAMGYITL